RVAKGVSRFGDCIDDEWFIVSILREITREFQGVVASLYDNDGEFLLIEAADHLPSWLDPSTSANRVFLYAGTLHLIPLPTTPAHIPLFPSGQLLLPRALDLIRSPMAPTAAPAAILAPITARLSSLPSAALSTTRHRALAHIPRSLARILRYDPQLISPAVEAFYTRDPIALKACQRMETFTPGRDDVDVVVTMNRVMFAQLKGQRFHPPKGFRMPGIKDKDWGVWDIGMKIVSLE
ncbi:hypothetical protein HKX48_007981, partial [Thoreauomyces humboldtii]